MAIQYWKHLGENRRTFLALEHAYHGDTFGAMSVSARGPFTNAFDSLLFAVKRLPFPKPPNDNQSDFSDEEIRFLEAMKTECAGNDVAAFIYEPLLLGAGGMKTWRPTVLDQAISIVRENHVLAIADEVLTGFGRTGTFLASDQSEHAPDIMTLSKGITGGFMPLGTTLTTQAIFDAFLSTDRTKTFFHGHSYTGNPLACAAAVASLKIFDEEPVMQRIEAIAQVHRERMKPLAERLGHDYRHLGTMAAMEPRASAGYLSSAHSQLASHALDRGLLIRPLGDVVYFLPPYSSTANDLHQAYDVLADILT